MNLQIELMSLIYFIFRPSLELRANLQTKGMNQKQLESTNGALIDSTWIPGTDKSRGLIAYPK